GNIPPIVRFQDRLKPGCPQVTRALGNFPKSAAHDRTGAGTIRPQPPAIWGYADSHESHILVAGFLITAPFLFLNGRAAMQEAFPRGRKFPRFPAALVIKRR